jgi:uncharacterized protein with HEPN domain
MREDRGRLRDILDAAKRIERYAKRGRRAFEDDELVHTWMIHHIQIIGEAASKLTPAFRKTHQPSSLATDHQNAPCVDP